MRRGEREGEMPERGTAHVAVMSQHDSYSMNGKRERGRVLSLSTVN